jgi:hypothetical protein
MAWQHDNESLEKYERKIKLIRNIKSIDKQLLKNTFDELAGKTSVLKKVINSAFYGILQGGATGFVTGGIPGALGGSIVFGTVLPIITTHRELSPFDETLLHGFKK